jgi:transcriptional regulator with XRE-family HTH domain
MTNLNPQICQKIKEARRAARLSQSALAFEVGCKQSALSMFEQGDGTKLNDDVIHKLAEKFKIDLAGVDSPNDTGDIVSAAAPVQNPGEGFCPNPNCPSNHAYQVDGRKLLRPDRNTADPVGGRFCAVCGEVLEKKCPNCGAYVHDGAFCSLCGNPYVVV